MAEQTTLLKEASEYVAEAKRALARQQVRLAKLKALGEPTWDAERTIEVYISTLQILQDHELMLRRQLH